MPYNKVLLVVFSLATIGLVGGIAYMYIHQAKSLPILSRQNYQFNSQVIIPPSLSDQQLDKDSKNIDDNLNKLDGELGNVDSGLNDQPTSIQ